MDTTILQVPVDKSLRNQAAAAAASLGFSSLQEAVRVFLAQLPTQTVKISFEPKPIQLSTKAIYRYNKIIDEIDSGKADLVSFDNVDDMTKYLSSQK